jgi:carbonic anhydrase
MRSGFRKVRKTMRLPNPVLLALILVTTASLLAQEHTAAHAWTYKGADGPSHWGDLKPEYATCKIGKHESPIDIRNPQKADLPAIQFNYRPTPLHIIDNGHTVQINYAPGSSIQVGAKHYELKQFHFHRPSEEEVNGKRHDMVAHLVHADADGNVAVVAVLLSKGNANALLAQLWKNLPGEKEKESTLDNIQINAADLLPSDHGYYTFSGSLTTPPCSENVTWFVLKTPTSISAAEIGQFAKIYAHNARPVQPLNDRVVQETK